MPPTKAPAASDAAQSGEAGGAAPAAPAGTTTSVVPPAPADPGAANQGFLAVKKQADEQSTSGHGGEAVPADDPDFVPPAQQADREGAKPYTVKRNKFFFTRAQEGGRVGEFKKGDTLYATDEEAKRLRRAGHIE